MSVMSVLIYQEVHKQGIITSTEGQLLCIITSMEGQQICIVIYAVAFSKAEPVPITMLHFT